MLHACCAPCSSAIVEWLQAHDIQPVIYYYNPNIYPESEYEIRKAESKRHAESLGIEWIEGSYDHEAWLRDIKAWRTNPSGETDARFVSTIASKLPPRKPLN